MTDVVITGVGLVLPQADTLTDLTDAADRGQSALTPLTRFAPDGHTSPAAAVVDDTQLSVFPARLRKRMDRFCSLSMVAAQRALSAADLLATDGTVRTDTNLERTGVYFANMFGGWEIAEDSMRRLCQVGYIGVSPYVASAWFPTASQGQISIHWGLRGFSKTIVGDTASGALAVGYAADAIRDGRADIMLAGGAEAPVTPYTYTFCTTSGRTSPTGYRPFHPAADGFQVGEGAVVFVLESRTHAQQRGVRMLAEIAGFAAGHAPRDDVFGPDGSRTLARVAANALSKAGAQTADVGYVGLDAQGTVPADDSELAALSQLLGPDFATVTRRSVKPLTGHLLGAAPCVELAAAIPAVTDPSGSRRTALINARGADGTVACCVLRAV